MAELYRATLGSGGGAYAFDVLPNIAIRSSAVIRDNAAPNVRVAVNYEFRLRCRVPASSDALATVPPSAATNLGTFLSTLIHTRTIPAALTIVDSAGTAIPQIGSITGSGWEDLQLVDFNLPDGAEQPGQLMAGAYFELTFRARRALADGNGICELSQVYEDDTDETGASVRRLTSTIRLSQAAYDAGTRITTAAIAAKLRVDLPSGWSRTIGNNSRGFRARYPLYEKDTQDGLLAETVSEVRSGGGVVGASGATKSEVSTRIKQDPEKGLVRTTTVAETTGPLSSIGMEWVEAQKPSDEATGETLEEPSARHARGEWEVLSALSPGGGKVRRVRRRYAMRGGGRSARSIPMASGYRPRVVLGPHTELRLVETIDVLAQGALTIADVPLPLPLEAPWILDGETIEDALPSVDEDAGYASQRLWLRVGTRQYLWHGPGEPLDSKPLLARVMADAGKNTARVEVDG